MKKCVKKCYLLLSLALAVSFTLPVSAADLDDLYRQRDQLADELDKAQSASQQKSKDIKSLQDQIANLEDEVKSTEAKIAGTVSEIDKTQAEIEGLSEKIKAKTDELNELKKEINVALVEIYRFSARSSWEFIFGSGTLGESSNQVKYVEAIQIQVKSQFNKLTEVKKDLDKQKEEQEARREELDNLKARQEEYKRGSEYQMGQKDRLKNMSAQQKEDYDAQAQKLKSEITNISAEIYAERQKRLSGGSEHLVGGGSGYPYSAIDVPDAWGFLTRECTSYAAWYWNVVLGKSWYNTRPGSGSAYNWPNLAADQGYSVSSSPSVGAIISWSAGSLTSAWGHVAIVEKVNGDGTIDLSEYNWIRYSYSYRANVDPGSYGSYSYIK